MKARASSPARLHVPPLVYAGEREALLTEREEVRAGIERFRSSPRLRAGWERRLIQITARLLEIERDRPMPAVKRADLQ